MARQCRGKIRILVEIDEIETDVGADSRTVVLPHRIAYEWDFDSGVTDGTEINRVWSTDAASTTTPDDADLQGSLASVLNGSNTVVLADLVGLVVVNDAASGSGDVLVGAGTNPVTAFHAAADVEAVKPRGIFLWVAPFGGSVAAGASDILRMVASAGSVAKRAILFGRST